MAAAATSFNNGEKRYAVVTGANRGIGFEICRQLASQGIVVVLTARDEKIGLDAFQRLKASGFSDNLVFHQLDVVDSSSVASLAQFIKTEFGRLDILVNNAAVGGVVVDYDALRAAADGAAAGGEVDWGSITTQTYEKGVECLEINYFGAKRMVEVFLPLLQLSPSPRIVNVSSSIGLLKSISNEWAKGVLSDGDNLTEGRVNEVVKEYIQDLERGCYEAKGWPSLLSAYTMSKAAMNAYTRILAKKIPDVKSNCICPGYVKTEGNHDTGIYPTEEGAACIVKLALLPPQDVPSGLFFNRYDLLDF